MTALLIDLDGVLRVWDPAIISTAEQRAALPAGSLAQAAFGDTTLLLRAVTGVIDDDAWRDAIARSIDRQYGSGGQRAVADWSAPAGAVDPEVLAIVREQRRRRRVGLLTNATSRLPDDLARLGLTEEFDAIINSADHGVAKPDPRIFEVAARHLGCEVQDILFVDDTLANVSAASTLGASALHFTTADQLRGWLSDLDRTPLGG